MNIKSKLRTPDSATMVGLATATGVYLIYQNAVPSFSDLRVSAPNDEDADMARKHAAWISALLIGAVFSVSRNFDSFIISGSALVALDFLHKHNNAINPATGKYDVDNASISGYRPTPDYDESDAAS